MNAALIGNARAVAAIERALASASPPHAWVFVGPEGVGKATVARWLAQAVNCEALVDAFAATNAVISDQLSVVSDPAAPRENVWPCGECAQCVRIARGIHADVVTVTIPPPEDGVQHKDISVDQVREVEQAVALAPFEGRTRVVMIDPADDLSIGAQNAFLKTLEEPPPNAVFVLIATREEALLQTVRSRCRRVEFTLVPAREIEAALRERGVDADRARLLALLAGGRPGRALELAEDPSHIEKRREVLEQARVLGSMPMADLMDLGEALARKFKDDREAVLDRLAEWLGWWRDLVLVQSDAEDGVANVDVMDGLREDAGRYPPADVITFVQALRECRRRLEANVQARIALDAMLVTAPRAASRAR